MRAGLTAAVQDGSRACDGRAAHHLARLRQNTAQLQVKKEGSISPCKNVYVELVCDSGQEV
jgi:hypothetical protein